MEEILLFLRRLKNDTINKIDGLGTSFETWKTDWTTERAAKIDTTADAIAELDADVGETADVGGTQTAGTVNAKLNAVLQKQKVIRGLAEFKLGTISDHITKTIELPQTINPEYANISVRFLVSERFSDQVGIVVVNVTNTTVEVRFHDVQYSSSYKAYVEWQVVGGIV